MTFDSSLFEPKIIGGTRVQRKQTWHRSAEVSAAMCASRATVGVIALQSRETRRWKQSSRHGPRKGSTAVNLTRDEGKRAEVQSRGIAGRKTTMRSNTGRGLLHSKYEMRGTACIEFCRMTRDNQQTRYCSWIGPRRSRLFDESQSRRILFTTYYFKSTYI